MVYFFDPDGNKIELIEGNAKKERKKK